MMRLPRALVLALAGLGPFTPVSADEAGYRIEYDFAHPEGEIVLVGEINPQRDFGAVTAIPGLNGDDYGFGYSRFRVALGEMPARERTRIQRSAYEFFHESLRLCEDEPRISCAGFVFGDGFEVR